MASKLPGVSDIIGKPGEHKTLRAAYDQLSGVFGSVPTKLFEIVHAAINIFAVGVMAIYLSLHPALYREWLIALFPPIHRDLVRDVLADLADSLRAYIVGQLLTMTFLGAITGARTLFAARRAVLRCRSESSPASSRSCRSSARCCRRRSRRCSFSPATGYHGFSPLGHALLVVGLGVVVHLIEGNIVSPLVMSKKVDLPPVLTIMSVLVIGQLLGGLGLIVALPTLAALMVIVRRILITPDLRGSGLPPNVARAAARCCVCPVPGGGVLVPTGPAPDIVTFAESDGSATERVDRWTGGPRNRGTARP